ncbi:hypothetical protein WJX82_000512 [Trebouxia sp. C0006]
MVEVKEELHAAKRDASRQHARELQLDLTQAHMANAALRLQIDETQREVAAEHERSNAAESALEAQGRERRAAEYARSRPTSPHRDAALHAELAHLRLQVAEITGRLQHAEQTHTDLLTQIRSSPLQPPASSDTHAPASQASLAYTAAGMSLVDAAGRRSGVAPNRRSGQGRQADVWVDSVPPTRMPEEKLQQAREDYMKEKNRVREKRLQELAAKAGDGTDAS